MMPLGKAFLPVCYAKKDLIDIIVPYFAEVLRNNEFCMRVTSLPLEAKEANTALPKRCFIQNCARLLFMEGLESILSSGF